MLFRKMWEDNEKVFADLFHPELIRDISSLDDIFGLIIVITHIIKTQKWREVIVSWVEQSMCSLF